MAYREVTMIEVKEVLRLWFAGTATKRIAAILGLDPKTVRRYVKVAGEAGVRPGPAAVTDAQVTAVLLALHPPIERPHGDSWAACAKHRADIEKWLKHELRLTKIRTLLGRQGVKVPYATLHRYAVSELGFGRRAATVGVVDGEPGQELQLDTGWVGWLRGTTRRRFRAWIFTAVRSRHRFVYPIFRETTATAIEACEAAWTFYGGVFRVLIPDNTKAIVHTADNLEPKLVDAFLEYAQARGFHVDPTRVRHPQDKGRVERAVATVRDDCFAGEELIDLDAARTCARRWCHEEYGHRRHSRTQRRPLEHFEAEERPALQPAPVEAYDLPAWSDPKVGRDHYALVACALYSLPTRWIGVRLRARADRATVRFYHRGVLIKTHPRCPPGGKSTHAEDFPAERTAYALRDITYLQTQGDGHGEAVGRYVRALLEGPLPWTRMRRVYAVLGLARRYGSRRVDEACHLALVAGMLDVHRLQRMLALAVTAAPSAPAPPAPAPARFLRPATQYRLALVSATPPTEGEPE
jgi:transposase